MKDSQDPIFSKYFHIYAQFWMERSTTKNINDNLSESHVGNILVLPYYMNLDCLKLASTNPLIIYSYNNTTSIIITGLNPFPPPLV